MRGVGSRPWIEVEQLAKVDAFRGEQADRCALPALTLRDKLGLVLTLGVTAGLVALLIWWLESRRQQAAC